MISGVSIEYKLKCCIMYIRNDHVHILYPLLNSLNLRDLYKHTYLNTDIQLHELLQEYRFTLLWWLFGYLATILSVKKSVLKCRKKVPLKACLQVILITRRSWLSTKCLLTVLVLKVKNENCSYYQIRVYYVSC